MLQSSKTIEKVAVIGLDCAEPSLVFERWRDILPNLSRLADAGCYGTLTSTIPPITVPAWTAMMTSQDPGQLGIYGFRNRKDHSYDGLYFANANYVKAKTVWNHLAVKRKNSILLGVPQTYPPRPLRGIMVASFLTPGKDAEFTYPKDVKQELDSIADGDYVIDVKDFRTDDKDRLLEQIYDMTRKRFKVARAFVQRKPWDFFMMVEMGTDRIHHGFWRFSDPEHRLYEPGSRYEHVIRDYYVYLDSEIGRLVGELPPKTGVMVVSDHGAKGMKGAICVNEWLIREGLLTLKARPDTVRKMTMDMIDWDKTVAWGEGGYYARIFMNVKGREPNGVVEQERYEAVRDDLISRFEAICDEKGSPIGTRVFRPEQIYREVRNVPPDLIVYFGNLNWRSAGSVGLDTIHLFENDTGPDDANHAQEGMYILGFPGVQPEEYRDWKGRRMDGPCLYDVAPTILDLFSIPVPPAMIGRTMRERFSGR
jgi:predicted AlkP superfamily phosphohydrolase/phosphomutase